MKRTLVTLGVVALLAASQLRAAEVVGTTIASTSS